MKENNIKKTIKKIIPIIVFTSLMVALTLILWPEIRKLSSEEGRAAFKSFIDSLGIWGVGIGTGLVLIQTLVAFIPGEPVELMMGIAFGPWLGTAVCLVGNLIGAILIYCFVKAVGKPYVKKILGNNDFKKLKFLEDERRIELFALILFIIPGTPKDALLYVFPFSSIKKLPYFLISTVARIPSVITSTILGDSVFEGEFLTAAIVFAVTLVLSFTGIILGNVILKRKENKGESDGNSEDESTW